MDEVCPECLQDVTEYEKKGWYSEGGCDTIPAMRDSYFFLPVQAEGVPFFQCPAKNTCPKKGKSVFLPPFEHKEFDHPEYFDPQVRKSEHLTVLRVIVCAFDPSLRSALSFSPPLLVPCSFPV